MSSVLFIGNFLGKTKGTLNPSEKLVSNLQASGFVVQSASSQPNIALRLIEIVCASFFKRYEVIHIDVFSGKALWFALVSATLASSRNKTIIINLHGGRLPELFQHKRKRLEYLFKKAEIIATPSHYIKEYFSGLGFKVTYLPNSINLAQFSHRWSTRALGQKKLLWVRAFADIYRPKFAIQILQAVRREIPGVTLTMVGPQGNAFQEVLDYIRQWNLEEQVLVHGPVQNQSLPEFFTTHSVFLNTTKYESFGMGVVEAMACGIPVVTSDVGELKYLWRHGHEALLGTSENASEYAQHIIKLLSDEKISQDLSLNARKAVEKFSWENIGPQWHSMLEKSYDRF